MRLLIYSYEFPPTRGGAGTYSYELASALQSMGHEIEVVALRQTATDDSFDKQCGLKVHRMNLWQGEPPFNHHYLMKVYWAFRFQMVLVADRGSQGAVAHMPLPFFPYCVTVHGSEVWAYFNPQISKESPADRDLYYQLFSRAKGVIAVSNATAQLLTSYVPDICDRLHVVLNGTRVERHTKPSLELTRSAREALGLQGKKIAFCLSRINIDKGHDVLVPAFASVVQQIPEAVLLIGGHGPLLVETQNLVQQLQLEEHVLILEEISDEELSAYYQLCDFFVLPSRCETRWEGFGLVFLEANCYEKPVIGGAAGGVPDAISDGENGFLVDPYDVQALADLMLRLFQDEDLCLKLGKQGRQRVLNNFTSERMAEETSEHLLAALESDQDQLSIFKLVKRRWRFFYWISRIAIFSFIYRIRKITSLL